MEEEGGWKGGITSQYLKIQNQMSKSKFMKSCISEGLLPNGVRGNFSLAMDVNNLNPNIGVSLFLVYY